MVQQIFGLGIGATGIVGTLIIAGIFMQKLNVSPSTGNIALGAGVLIGILLGLLGVAGVMKRVFH
jgi:hypothetical protein